MTSLFACSHAAGRRISVIVSYHLMLEFMLCCPETNWLKLSVIKLFVVLVAFRPAFPWIPCQPNALRVSARGRLKLTRHPWKQKVQLLLRPAPTQKICRSQLRRTSRALRRPLQRRKRPLRGLLRRTGGLFELSSEGQKGLFDGSSEGKGGLFALSTEGQGRLFGISIEGPGGLFDVRGVVSSFFRVAGSSNSEADKKQDSDSSGHFGGPISQCLGSRIVYNGSLPDTARAEK